MVLAKQVSLVSVQLFGVGVFFCLVTSDVFLQHFFFVSVLNIFQDSF